MLGLKPHISLSFTKKLLPFSDAASTDLPLGQLLRLSLFQISVGMATVLLLGTLNRVMIVELGCAGDYRCAYGGNSRFDCTI
jgi:BCD family chlorophyll transporter-like MFS transporter